VGWEGWGERTDAVEGSDGGPGDCVPGSGGLGSGSTIALVLLGRFG
jgi:hypothetical protein